MPRVATRLQTPVQLAIRLNKFDGYEEKLKTFFTPGDTFDAVYGISHKGKSSNNPHWHFAVEAWFPKDTIRARIAKEFSQEKGNKNHSVKEWDGDETYIQYTLKELKDFNDINDVLVCNARTGGFLMNGNLEKLHARSQMIVDEIKDNTPTKICMRIAEMMLESDLRVTDYEIFRLICKYLMKRGKFLPNKFQAERWVLQVKVCIAQIEDAKTSGEKSQEAVIKNLYENYFLSRY